MNYSPQKIGTVSTLHKCFYYGGISKDVMLYLIYTIEIKLIDSI